VQSVWNGLTGRAVDHGIADYDIFYFDTDTSWTAEDVVIRKLRDRLAAPGVRIEPRNQARVHLWYTDKHGLPYPPLAWWARFRLRSFELRLTKSLSPPSYEAF
jgi:hypothetical protein